MNDTTHEGVPAATPGRMPAALSADELRQLADVARQAVLLAVRDRVAWWPDPADHPPALREPRAAFVTLRRHGRLRGCIGTMVGERPLVECVADRARAAAFADPRFDPVQRDELDDLDVSVSVLSPMEPFTVNGYDDLVRTLRPGVEGLLVEAGRCRATFLPSVWEELPDPADFVAHLWRKAGLPPRAWPPGITTSRYVAQHAG